MGQVRFEGTVPGYIKWQRAARAAIEDGRQDWHEWATEHATTFAISRPAEPAG